MLKKFGYLNKSKEEEGRELYHKIMNLPFSNYPDHFEEDFSDIISSTLISPDLKKYLNDKAQEKEFWVKGFMKSKFCCGMCSSSRIESKHRVLKQFLNSGMRLSELFTVVKKLEKIEITQFEKEIQESQKNERKKKEKIDMIIYFKDVYSDYVIERLKDNTIDSINYKVVPDPEIESTWYVSLICYLSILRTAHRKTGEQTMVLKNGKLECSCEDPTFTGIPCRHLIALASSEKNITFENLVFNVRWKKQYFSENMSRHDPDELDFETNETENQDFQIQDDNNQQEDTLSSFQNVNCIFPS